MHYTVLVVGPEPYKQLANFQMGGLGEISTPPVLEILSPAGVELAGMFGEVVVKDEKTGKFGRWIHPNAKWDGCELGGRWHNILKLKAGRSGIPKAESQPGSLDSSRGVLDLEDKYRKLFGGPSPVPEQKAGYTAQALKGDIDFEGMRLEARIKAGNMWDEFHAEGVINGDPSEEESGSEGEPETKEEFVLGRETFATSVLLHEGVWHEISDAKGVAAADNHNLTEKEESAWRAKFKELLKAVPDDALLSVYDCHK